MVMVGAVVLIENVTELECLVSTDGRIQIEELLLDVSGVEVRQIHDDGHQ